VIKNRRLVCQFVFHNTKVTGKYYTLLLITPNLIFFRYHTMGFG